MAGSNKWFTYTTDNDDEFALYADESNTEAVNGTDGDLTAVANPPYAIPKNLKPRTAVYKNANGTRSIRCIVLTRAKYDTVLADTPTIPDPITDGETLNLAQVIPERYSPLPRPADSGLNDGDAT